MCKNGDITGSLYVKHFIIQLNNELKDTNICVTKSNQACL